MELFTQEGYFFILRWIHFLAGITWIGVLYYFNFIQTPFFGSELGGQAKGLMTRGLVPNALWWFRWGAMFTFLTGWLIILTKLGHDGVGLGIYWVVALIVMGAVEANGLIGPGASSQKPLTTVSGTISATTQ